MYLIRFLLSYKIKSRNKKRAFERGFRSVGNLQRRFSIHFFTILLIFILFDLEIVLLLRLVVSSPYGVVLFSLIILFVLGRVYLEWTLGKLKWIF